MIHRGLHRFFKNTRGDVSIEFAFILPVIITLFAGIYELSVYSLAYNKISRITEVIGDMVSRQNVSQTTILSYCAQAIKIMTPFDFAAGGGQIVVSQVQNTGGTTSAANVKMSWQVKYNNGTSKFGTTGTATGFPNGLSVTGNQAAIIVEVYYTYVPKVFNMFTSTKLIYQYNFFVPRIGQMSTLLTS